MHAKDLFAAAHVRTRDDYTAVKAAGAQQCGIKHIRTVGGGDQDHAVIRFKAVHLDQQLVESLFALVVSTAEASATMATDSVDLVNENDARRVLFALLEEVAHAACAHADKHFNEVRTGDREERHISFAGHSAGEQSLAGSGRPNQKHTLRDASAQLLEFLRFAQELDDLVQLFLGFINAGD